MRHPSAVPLLSTAMIAVLMLSMSILIACALVTARNPGRQPSQEQRISPAPRHPRIRRPTRPGGGDPSGLSPEMLKLPPDLSGETARHHPDGRIPAGNQHHGTKPVEPAKPASLAPPAEPMKEMKSDKDSVKAKAKNFFGTFVEGPRLRGPSSGAAPYRDDKSPPATGMTRRPAPRHRKTRQPAPAHAAPTGPQGRRGGRQPTLERVPAVHQRLRRPAGPPHQPRGPADNHRPGPGRKPRAQRHRHRERQREEAERSTSPTPTDEPSSSRRPSRTGQPRAAN